MTNNEDHLVSQPAQTGHTGAPAAPAPTDPGAPTGRNTADATARLLVRSLHSLEVYGAAQSAVAVAGERGLLHVDARFAGVGDDAVAGSPRLVQRRDYARVDAVLEVRVAPDIAAVAVNISGSGAVVARLDGLTTGDLAELSLQLEPHEPPIMITGRVVRECDGHLRAVHFERVSPDDRARIAQFVFERQRLGLPPTNPA